MMVLIPAESFVNALPILSSGEKVSAARCEDGEILTLVSLAGFVVDSRKYM